MTIINLRIILCGFFLFIPINVNAFDRILQSFEASGYKADLAIPNNMKLEYLAHVAGARFADFGPDQEILIGSNSDIVYRLPPPYDRAEKLIRVGGHSHSVAYHKGRLFIADRGGLYVTDYAGISTRIERSDLRKLIDFPRSGHWSRTVIIGPDGDLYISIGISSNCSDEFLAGENPDYPLSRRRGGVWKLKDYEENISELIAFSSGLRNPIGIAFHPDSGELWATNAGSDDLGYHEPKEVLTRLTQGSFHGMPWYQFIRGKFREQKCIASTSPIPVEKATKPSLTFKARSTPQGIAFVTGNELGKSFQGNALISIHGSWAVDHARGGGRETRREPKIVMVRFDSGFPYSVTDVITGFQHRNGTRLARPSGALMGPDGNFFFTSDGGDLHGLFKLSRITDTK